MVFFKDSRGSKITLEVKLNFSVFLPLEQLPLPIVRNSNFAPFLKNIGNEEDHIMHQVSKLLDIPDV